MGSTSSQRLRETAPSHRGRPVHRRHPGRRNRNPRRRLTMPSPPFGYSSVTLSHAVTHFRAWLEANFIMSKYEVLTILISLMALLCSVGSVVYTVHVTRRFRHADALQQIRNVVVANTARFNSILSSIKSAIGQGELPPEESFEKAAELYAEVQNAFNAHKHQFSDEDRTEIATAFDGVEKLGLSRGQRYTAMATALALIHKKLTGE